MRRTANYPERDIIPYGLATSASRMHLWLILLVLLEKETERTSAHSPALSPGILDNSEELSGVFLGALGPRLLPAAF